MSPSTRNSAWKHLEGPVRVLTWLLLVAAALAIYREAESLVTHVFFVVLLFAFAAVIAIVLTPLVDLVQRIPGFRSRRWLAVLLLGISFGALLVLLGLLLVPPLIDQARHVPELLGRAQDQLHQWGITVNLRALVSGSSRLDLAAELGIVGGVINSIVSAVLVVVISIYLLIEGRTLVATLRNLFPDHTRIFDFAALALSTTTERYVRGQILMSLIIGSYMGIAMALIGVHFAVVLGVLAGLLELVPIAGAIIAMALATAVALLQSPSLGILALIVGLAGHALEAYIVGPRINGRVTQLHPLVALAALLIGGEIGGVLGAVFSVPVAAVANIVLGAAYRSRQGDTALTTHARGKLSATNLPRLSDEIGGVDSEGVVSDPVPREKNKNSATE